MEAETGQTRPPYDVWYWLALDKGSWNASCTSILGGAILSTFKASDACVLTNGGWGDHPRCPSPGSYIFAFRLRGKDGYMYTILRRMLYVPNLPLPLVLSELDEERREGSFINKGTDELTTREGGVIELVVPDKEEKSCWGANGWGASTRWLQVTPVTDTEIQQQLLLAREKELAEAAAEAAAKQAAAGEVEHAYGEDEDWGGAESTFWHDDATWGWAFINPEAEADSPPPSPQPLPGPEGAPSSPSYSPQPSPVPEAGPASPSYSPQLTPEPEAMPPSPRD